MRQFAILGLLAIVYAGRGSAAPTPQTGDARATLAAAGGAEPTAAAVLARAKQASGGKAWDAIGTRHVRARLHVGGLDGAAESIEDVRSGHHELHYSLGPLRGASGFDGTTAWTQDASGQARAEERDRK